VQGLGADDDGGRRHAVLERVPARVAGAAPDPHEVGERDAAAVGDGVLAVAREDEVVVPQRAGGADLRGLLAQQRRPQAELALPLQGRGLDVDPPADHHVLVQRGELLRVDVGHPGREILRGGGETVLDPFPGGGEELHRRGDRREGVGWSVVQVGGLF
jgi:hypothetical protein